MAKRILVALGTRPEAIKLAPVIAALRQPPDRFCAVVCGIAQHREMLDQVLEDFAIPLDYDLDVMQDDQSLPKLTGRVLRRFDRVLEEATPDFVLVQGDTTSAMLACLAAFYRRIPTGHVEAGLRTHNRYYPFPEEVNRRLITTLATLHFAPTASARENLLREGVDPATIVVTGNTVIDALHLALSRPVRPAVELPAQARLVLMTAHRRENFGPPLEGICEAVRRLVLACPDLEMVIPVHPNPQVRSTMTRSLAQLPRIHLVEPLPYRQLVHLMARATLILTDSGGIQEEAPALGKPVLVLRNETERPEGVASENTVLVGTDPDRILTHARRLLEDPATYARMAQKRSPYGDGHASERIVEALVRWYAASPPVPAHQGKGP